MSGASCTLGSCACVTLPVYTAAPISVQVAVCKALIRFPLSPSSANPLWPHISIHRTRPLSTIYQANILCNICGNELERQVRSIWVILMRGTDKWEGTSGTMTICAHIHSWSSYPELSKHLMLNSFPILNRLTVRLLLIRVYYDVLWCLSTSVDVKQECSIWGHRGLCLHSTRPPLLHSHWTGFSHGNLARPGEGDTLLYIVCSKSIAKRPKFDKRHVTWCGRAQVQYQYYSI